MVLSISIDGSQYQACVIWMHGLGADASDMMGLAKELPITEVTLRHVFMDAPKRAVTLNAGMVMPAWYDITGLNLIDREDKQGIEQSEQLVLRVIEEQIEEGFALKQIFLAGFSQGGAMALHTALHIQDSLAGVIALSAYLPLATFTKPKLDKSTPFFMGSGQFDPLVLPTWSALSKEWLVTNGYQNIAFHSYPMEHSICYEEIKDLSLWISQQIKGVAPCL